MTTSVIGRSIGPRSTLAISVTSDSGSQWPKMVWRPVRCCGVPSVAFVRVHLRQRLDDAQPGLIQEMLEYLGKARVVARFERRYHRLVLGNGARPFVRLLVADEADAFQPRGDRLVQ